MMKIEKTPEGMFSIRATEEELLILNNALNEICNGLPLRDFETRVGASLSSAEALLKEVGTALDENAAH
jgi:hypothetical protein